MTERIPPTDDYTIVYNTEPLAARDDPHSACVRDLIRDRIDRDGRSLVEIATIAGMSRRALGRIIAGQKPLRLVDLKQLSEALGIDRARAVIAIDILGDWTAYDDPVLCILMRLFAPVCSKVDAGADFPIEPLTAAAEEKFANWLADILVANQEQIRKRRDDFVKLPTL